MQQATTVQILQILSLAFGIYTVVCLPIAYVWFQKKFIPSDREFQMSDSLKRGLELVRQDIKDTAASIRQDVHNEFGKVDLRLTFQKEQSERNFHELRELMRKLSEDIEKAQETATQAVHRLELYKAEIEPRLTQLEKTINSRKSAS